MNYGRFFEFDFESSYLQKGMAVFNYRWLQDTNVKPNDKNTPRFPVYLTLSPESICFNLHYSEKTEEGWNHFHNTIIEIRVSSDTDVTDGLTGSINNVYDAQFPMKQNQYLRKLVERSFDAQDCPTRGYSTLQRFSPEKKEDYGDEGTETHLLRKIVLDFLFDFEFTNVFKNVAFYDDLSVKLKKNFVFNALMNKTRYYYYRTVLCAEEVVGCCTHYVDDIQCDKSLKLFFERYAKAEHDWVSSIMDNRAMEAFHESPWFDESYLELEQVYSTNRLDKWKKDEEETERGPLPVPSCLKDYKCRKKRSRWRYLKRIGALDDSFKLSVGNLLNLIRKKTHEPIDVEKLGSYGKAIAMHCDTAKEAVRWEVSHYHFVRLWRLWFGEAKTALLSLALVLPFVLAAFCWFKAMYKPDNGWSLVLSLGSLMLFLMGMGFVMRRRFRSTWAIGGMAMIMPRLLAAIVTAWFTMSMSEDLVHYFWAKGMSWSACAILWLTTLLFVAFESRSVNPFNRWYHHLASSAALYLIAYFYAAVVGLMVYNFFGRQILMGGFAYQDINTIKVIPESIDRAEYIVPYIAQFSFFATFIGIFLQLMFQGKSVTETK